MHSNTFSCCCLWLRVLMGRGRGVCENLMNTAVPFVFFLWVLEQKPKKLVFLPKTFSPKKFFVFLPKCKQQDLFYNLLCVPKMFDFDIECQP